MHSKTWKIKQWYDRRSTKEITHFRYMNIWIYESIILKQFGEASFLQLGFLLKCLKSWEFLSEPKCSFILVDKWREVSPTYRDFTILFLRLLLSFSFDWEDISNIRDSLSSYFQTPRISSKILCCPSYFQLSSQCLDNVIKHCLSCLILLINSQGALPRL